MLLCAFLTATLVNAAQAEYDVVFLHPGTSRSLALSSSNGIHSGMVGIGASLRAAVWKGTSSSYEFIGPAGNVSRIKGSFGDYQIGNIDPGERGCTWQSSLSSHVMLLPVSPSHSSAFSIQGEQIVGKVETPENPAGLASLWYQGTLINLHPADYTESSAEVTDGIHQYGTARRQNGSLARLRWKGSASSAEIYPVVPNAARNGQIIAEKNMPEVGFMRGIWTPTTFVPFGLSNVTSVVSTSGEYQCGYIRGGEVHRATVWQGTAESKIDLHALLPSQYIDSLAKCVDEDGNVYGHASEWELSADHVAVMWKRRGASTTLVPARALVVTGIRDAGQLGDMLWSNDTYLEVLPSYAGARLDPNITIQTEHPSGVFTGSALRIRVESSVNSPGIERTVQVFNWNTSSWDLLNLGIAPQIDEAQELLISQGVPNYLGSQGVRVRMNWRSTAAAGSRSWKAKMDNIRVVIDPPTP